MAFRCRRGGWPCGLAVVLCCTADLAEPAGRPAPKSSQAATHATAPFDAAIRRAVTFLKNAQLPSGEFPSVICQDAALTQCESDHTPFVTTFALHALIPLSGGPVKAIATRGVQFLLSVHEPDFLWRYWTTQTPRHASLNPDLDDTVCARAALIQYGARQPWSLHPVLALRAPSGGLYTWTLLPPEQNAIDCAVNANALYYFVLEDAVPDTLVTYLNGIVARQQADSCSAFYVNPLAFSYFMARAIRLEPKLRSASPPLIEQTLARQLPDGSFGSPLETALGAATLLALEAPTPRIQPAIQHLLASQAPDGGFPALVFYKGPQGCTTNCQYFGAASITTAVALEAYIDYRNRLTRAP